MTDNRNRVFISYNYNDSSIALRISDSLRNENIEVVFDYKDISIGLNVFDQIRYMYETSETVMVLLSQSLFNSEFFRFEFPKYFFDEARKRKINIIPVLVEKCQVPSDFLEYDTINLTSDYNKGLQRIVQKLRIIPEISFEEFTPILFEKFTYDLLKSYGFKSIQREQRINDFGIDFIAESFFKDAFGFPNKEVWMIETKFYREERFSINSLNKIIESFKYINRIDAKILLITNSVLTSVAEEFIEDTQRNKNIEIKVLDGAKLKKVVAKRKRLLKKYFLR